MYDGSSSLGVVMVLGGRVCVGIVEGVGDVVAGGVLECSPERAQASALELELKLLLICSGFGLLFGSAPAAPRIGG